MAELCLKCFLDTWSPNAYDRAHIVMSNDNEFCEGCMNCGPYIDHIDQSNRRLTPTVSDFVRVVAPEIKAGRKVACMECGAIFEDDDLAFVHETGECPYCHARVRALWMKG